MAMPDFYRLCSRLNPQRLGAIAITTLAVGGVAKTGLSHSLGNPNLQPSALVSGEPGVVRAHVDRRHTSRGLTLNTEHWLLIAQCRDEANLDTIPSGQLSAREYQAARAKTVLKLAGDCVEDVVKVEHNTSQSVSDGAIIAVPGPYKGQHASK